jgi:hypothetical protein
MMAIFHLNHRPIGRSTHRSGYAAAHARYILRSSAVVYAAATLPNAERTPAASVQWFRDRERTARANARLADRVVVALPLELSLDEQKHLLRDFLATLDPQSRCPMIYAIHARNEDAQNPHAHIMLIDADRETGKRVLMLSERKSTERLREAWEQSVNRALEQKGLDVRVDRRTLAAQGIEREPEIHVGPAGSYMAARTAHERSQINNEIRERNALYDQLQAENIQLLEAEAELLEEVSERRSQYATFVPVEEIAEVLAGAEEAIVSLCGPEPIPPESLEQRIARGKAQGRYFYYDDPQYRADYEKSYREYEEQRKSWDFWQALIESARKLYTNLKTIAQAGITALLVEFDTRESGLLSWHERIANVGEAVRQTVDDLGERYTHAQEELVTVYSSESLGFCRSNDVIAAENMISGWASWRPYSELIVHRNCNGEMLYAEACDPNRNETTGKKRLTAEQLERVRASATQNPVTEQEISRIHEQNLKRGHGFEHER